MPASLPCQKSEKTDNEIVTQAALLEYLIARGQKNPEKNMNELLSAENFDCRFDYIEPFIPDNFRNSILISGCSVGSEILAAKKYGYTNVVGTEVDEELIRIAKIRFAW